MQVTPTGNPRKTGHTYASSMPQAASCCSCNCSASCCASADPPLAAAPVAAVAAAGSSSLSACSCSSTCSSLPDSNARFSLPYKVGRPNVRSCYATHDAQVQDTSKAELGG